MIAVATRTTPETRETAWEKLSRLGFEEASPGDARFPQSRSWYDFAKSFSDGARLGVKVIEETEHDSAGMAWGFYLPDSPTESSSWSSYHDGIDSPSAEEVLRSFAAMHPQYAEEILNQKKEPVETEVTKRTWRLVEDDTITEEYDYEWNDRTKVHATIVDHHDGTYSLFFDREDGSTQLRGPLYSVESAQNLIVQDANANHVRVPIEEAVPSIGRFFTEKRRPIGPGELGIYQLKEDVPNYRYLAYVPLILLDKYGDAVDPANYECIYVGEKLPEETLEGLFLRFNDGKVEGFKGHSLSVSDVVVVFEADEERAFYVDSFGFEELPGFLEGKPRESAPRVKQAVQEKGSEMEEEKKVEAAAQEETAKKVYVEFNKAFIKKRKAGEEEFYSVRLPEGVKIGGVDRGGWSFTQQRVFPSKYRDSATLVSFPKEDWKVKLSRLAKGEDGTETKDVAEVTAGALAAGVKEAAAEWKKAHSAKKVKSVAPSAGPRTIEKILEDSYPEQYFGEGDEGRRAAESHRAEALADGTLLSLNASAIADELREKWPDLIKRVCTATRAGLADVEGELENGNSRKYADAFLAMLLNELNPSKCVSAANMADRLQELSTIEAAGDAIHANRVRAASIAAELGRRGKEPETPEKAQKLQDVLSKIMRCPHPVTSRMVAEWAGITVPEDAVKAKAAPAERGARKSEAR